MVLKANEISTTDFYKAVETLKQITTGIKPGEMVLITAHENVGKTHGTHLQREISGGAKPNVRRGHSSEDRTGPLHVKQDCL